MSNFYAEVSSHNFPHLSKADSVIFEIEQFQVKMKNKTVAWKSKTSSAFNLFLELCIYKNRPTQSYPKHVPSFASRSSSSGTEFQIYTLKTNSLRYFSCRSNAKICS